MNTQVNWQKIRKELNRLTDVDNLKTEVQRIGTEIRNFDYHTVLSPAAKQKVKTFEKRYSVLMRTIQQAQRQVDREFSRIIRELKDRRQDVDKVVREQKYKLENLSQEFQKRFSVSTAAKSKAKTTKKTTTKSKSKTTKKAAPRKRKKA